MLDLGSFFYIMFPFQILCSFFWNRIFSSIFPLLHFSNHIHTHTYSLWRLSQLNGLNEQNRENNVMHTHKQNTHTKPKKKNIEIKQT